MYEQRLVALGQVLLGIYLGSSSIGTAYRGAGSLVVLLVWLYYSSLILLLGAELTQVYARKYGSGLRPEDNAMPVPKEARSQQGMKPKGRQDR